MAGSAPRTTRESLALLQSAFAQEESGDRRAAIATLEELCRRDPAYALGWAELSCLQLADGDYGRALSTATTALRLDPSLVPASINAGIAAHKLGDLAAARGYLEHAVRLDRDDPDAQLRLGQTFAALGELAAASDAYVRALGPRARDCPNDAWIIEGAARGLAEIEPLPALEGPIRALHEGVRSLVAGQLAHAHAHLERARDGPCGLGMSDVRAAATTLLGEVWRQRARMTPTPNDPERGIALVVDLTGR